jgi:putative ABC transport system permease protein
LGVIGAATGSLIGLGIVLILNFAGITFDFGMQKDLVLAATLSLRDPIATSGIVILVAVIASLQPALKASRMEPIKALRHV